MYAEPFVYGLPQICVANFRNDAIFFPTTKSVYPPRFDENQLYLDVDNKHS